MKVYPRSAERIAASRGETFVIVLEAMPAAGYEWMAAWDSDRLRVVKQVEVGSRSAIGAATTERFLVTPSAEGESTIELTYRQPWSGGAIEDAYVVRVAVAPPG